MRKLLIIILRFHFVFLFVLLEIVALSFIFQNHYHHAVVLNASGNISGSIYKVYTNITDYFHLKEANQQLAEENRKLKLNQYNQKSLSEPYRIFSPDTNFSIISAKVISSSIAKQKNYILIDKGSSHGIENDMGVIAPTGVVGMIIRVSPNFSLVQPIINTQSKISAKILRLNQQGSLRWDGRNYRLAHLFDIPTHVDIRMGDTITTSGYSFIFPANLLLGVIKESTINRKKQFFESTVDLSVDFNALFYVYVLRNNLKEELSELQKEENHE